MQTQKKLPYSKLRIPAFRTDK